MGDDYDLGISLAAATPAPIRKYVQSTLERCGVHVLVPPPVDGGDHVLLVTLPQALLELKNGTTMSTLELLHSLVTFGLQITHF